MVKAKLCALTERWIDGKTERQHTVKAEKQKIVEDKKIKQTFYMSEKAVKLLWHNRAETREPMSRTLEQLIIAHLGKGKEKE